MSDIRIRIAKSGDVGALTALSTQLGYPSSEDEIKVRLETIIAEAEHILLVAEMGHGEVVGWVHGIIRKLFVMDEHIEIGGLVVQEDFRGMGIGKKLLAGVEDWAREKGIGAISLRSNVVREEAHRFYQGMGYEMRKTSKIFWKILDS